MPTPTPAERRKAAGLTQVQLASRAQVSIGTVYSVEHGYRPVHPYIRRVLADVLGTTEAELFPREAATA
jgi:transcriptional regulator with XRE-family HTH domain